MLAHILAEKEFFEQAADCIGYKSKDIYKYGGYSVEDWVADFKLRMSMINYNQEKKKLDSLQSKLKELVSQEVKTAEELEEIAKLLK